MSIIKEVGLNYFLERWDKAFFKHEDNGRTCYINGGPSADRYGNNIGVQCTSIFGDIAKPQSEGIIIPETYFKDMSIFKTPPLGWRMANQGRYLAFFRRNNKVYRRGVCYDILQRWEAPSTTFLLNTGSISKDFFSRIEPTALMIMEPKYTPLHEGIAAMRKGELYSFAVSPNIAVIPDVDDTMALFFNTAKVGIVNKNNQVECKIPAVITMAEERAA